MRAAQFRAIIARLEADLATANKHVEVEVMKRQQYAAEIRVMRAAGTDHQARKRVLELQNEVANLRIRLEALKTGGTV